MHDNPMEKHMSRCRNILLIVTLLFLVGCKGNLLESLSDDSSREARIEDARMALNDGEYQRAIDILGPGYDPDTADPDTSRILASAYMGKAGIDLTYLIQNAPGSSSSFDIIASALSLHVVDSPQAESALSVEESLSSSARYIDTAAIDDFIASLEEAQTYLAPLVEANGNDDDIVQLGMVSVIHFILEVGVQAAAAAGVDNIPINREAFREAFPSSPDPSTLLTGFATNIDSTEGVLPSLISDIAWVDDAMVVIERRMGSDEDIAQKFDEFLTNLLGMNDPEDLTGTLIKDYVSDSLLGY
jgi:hypothetical protein